MQLRIVHTTGYRYEAGATASYNEARLTPATSAEQIVVHARLDIHPTPWTWAYRDYFGTHVTSFEVTDPHDALRVTSVATVHTNRAPAPPPALAWSELLDERIADEHCEYLAADPLVDPPADLAARVREIADRAARPGIAAREVCALIHSEMAYQPGSTDVLTTAEAAWEQRAGVCQDLAHLVVGALRSIGIPARYVSGYFHPDKEPPVGVAVAGQSHAWIEWWDAGWRGFDPTNDQQVSDRHVMMATGRDYRDVRPLAGVYSGAGASAMFVDVQITRLS
jgi:transglutaminase-like putative cysteine protease